MASIPPKKLELQSGTTPPTFGLKYLTSHSFWALNPFLEESFINRVD